VDSPAKNDVGCWKASEGSDGPVDFPDSFDQVRKVAWSGRAVVGLLDSLRRDFDCPGDAADTTMCVVRNRGKDAHC
jgi:hypothetical protein